jgi:hypothetical protein
MSQATNFHSFLGTLGFVGKTRTQQKRDRLGGPFSTYCLVTFLEVDAQCELQHTGSIV